MARLGGALAHTVLAGVLTTTFVSLPIPDAQAAELRVTCYSDGNECDVLRDLSVQYTAAHPATAIRVDQVPTRPSWRACRCSSRRERA